MSTGKNKYQNIYFSSLAAIALLVAASHIVIDSIVSEESLMVEVNEIGGRQRMLSERIVHLLLEYAVEKDPAIQANITRLIEQTNSAFDQTHKLLIRGQISNTDTVVFENNIDALFFGEPEYLDEKARLFIYNTREVLSHDWSPDLISSFYLKELREAAKESLHSGLDELASLYTNNSMTRITRLRIVVAVMLITVIMLVSGIGLFVFKPLFSRIIVQQDELAKLAYRDSLTDLHNRRSFFLEAEKVFQQCQNDELPFSVLFLDIDFLKVINDSFGHAMGDKVIEEVARVCMDNLGSNDIPGRIGGDEFGILLPKRSLQSATTVAEHLRHAMSANKIPGISGYMQVSLSIGVASVTGRDKNAFETINRADKNLYEAKKTGRNLIIAA
ncbi:MAG: diguanylate cyclase [Gammaproteobacteria bacterium]|nr:diguanylate cyclase [Gammaproteobacteria bacterium]